jgi:hypothetical protein
MTGWENRCIPRGFRIKMGLENSLSHQESLSWFTGNRSYGLAEYTGLLGLSFSVVQRSDFPHDVVSEGGG